MANTYLQRNMANSLTTDWTVSMWVKRSEIVRQQMLFSAYNNSTHDTEVFFDGDKLNFRNKRGGSFVFQVKTNRLFRDTNSFYHLVFQFHASGDSGVYAKIFVNGVQETDLNVNTQGSGETTWNNDKSHSIGSTVNGGADHFNGIISHMHFASTGIYAPTVFAETDATTGEWKGKTSPSVTYGTNGFFILKDGNGITDQSGEGNDFTLGGGTLTDLKDNPDNVFATLNPLQSLPVTNGSTYAGLAYSNGNTTAAETYGHWRLCASTLAGATGKFYAEIKRISGGTNNFYIGVASSKAVANNTNGYHYGKGNNTVGYDAGNGNIYVNDSGSSYGSGYANGDIIGIALDVTNLKVYFSKNGVWQNSGVPTSGSTGTGAISLTAGEDSWHIGMSPFNTTGSCNFGNGYFGTTAITTNSGNGYSGAEGSSKFNYTVPTGYSALSTKGLNE